MYKQMATEVNTIFSLPEVYLRLRKLLSRPSIDMEDLWAILRLDPGLSFRLLKIVNSSFYNHPEKIESIRIAVEIIGFEQLENLILATNACDMFAKIPSNFVDMSCFWHHSVYVAITSKLLAKHCTLPNEERLFIAGMFHDLGQLIIFQQAPDLAHKALAKAIPTDDGLYHAEKEIFGFTHCDLGAELFRIWGLPTIFIEVAEFHHEPRLSKNFTLETAIVNLANSLVNTLEPVRNIIECTPNCDPDVLKIIGLSKLELDKVLCEAENQFMDVIKIISPDAPLL